MGGGRIVIRVLAVVAVIALAPLLLSRLNPRPAPPQPTATPRPVVTGVVPAPPAYPDPAILGMAVPPDAAVGLRAIALGVAQSDGDPKPAWIMAVTTTLPQAIRVARPAGPVTRREPVVYLLVMKGDFAYNGADTHGSSGASGHYVTAIFDPGTLAPLGTTLTSRAPAIPLARLGPVLNLLTLPRSLTDSVPG
jgi:hypothetical protein